MSTIAQRPLPVHAISERYEAVCRIRLPAAAHEALSDSGRLHLGPAHLDPAALSHGRKPRLRFTRATSGVPATFGSILITGQDCRPGRIHENLGDAAGASSGTAMEAETDRRRRLHRPSRPLDALRPRWQANWSWPPTSSSSSRGPRRGCRPRPGRRRRDREPSSPAITGSPIGAATP